MCGDAYGRWVADDFVSYAVFAVWVEGGEVEWDAGAQRCISDSVFSVL